MKPIPLLLALCFAVIAAVSWMPKASIAAEMIISDYYWKNSYGRGAGTIPNVKASINGGVGHAPVALNKDRGPGVTPKYDSYGRGAGTPIISDVTVRTKKGNVTAGCSGDYPNHVGARCYKNNPVCTDRKGGGKSWGYDFNSTTFTCWRKKETTANGVPKSYVPDSKGESWGCPAGSQIILGGCFQNCPAGSRQTNFEARTGQPSCIGPKDGTCPTDKKKSGLLCYQSCRDGYHPDGLFCYKDKADLCGSDRILEDGLCYKRCPDGYKGHATMCTQVVKDQCASTEELDGGLCYKKCSIRSAKYPKRTGARCYTEGSTCAKSQENDAGLCYKKCRAGYKGAGPVCWGNTPRGYKACGAGYARDNFTCGFVTADQTLAAAQLAAALYGALPATKESRKAKAIARMAKTLKLQKGKEAEEVAGMVRALMKSGWKYDEALQFLTKNFGSIVTDIVKTADNAKAGRSILSPETLRSLYRFWTVGPGKAIRSKLWKVAGLGKYGASKSQTDEPPPFPTDPIGITRTSAEAYSLIYALVDMGCVATSNVPCQSFLNSISATALVTDVVAAYMWPVYGMKN